MNEERYKLLMNSDEPLTPEEIALGWHFCNEFYGLLVGPGQHELLSCHCWPEEHPIYKTRPEDPFQSEEYQKFVESMVPHCHCAERYRPCDGVLAGGVCDGMTDDKTSDSMEEKDEAEDDL